MAKPLNLNALKKKFFTVTLPDEKKTTLLIGTPTKAVMDEFIALQSNVDNADSQAEIMDDLYDICAKIMSRNRTKRPISKDFVAENMDFEDVLVFIKAYTEFIQEVSGGKN